MKFIQQIRLGSVALRLAGAVRDALKAIDAVALLEALAKCLWIERSMTGDGQGREKLDALLDWFREAWPQYAAHVDAVSAVVSAAVALYNAVGVFRKVNAS